LEPLEGIERTLNGRGGPYLRETPTVKSASYEKSHEMTHAIETGGYTYAAVTPDVGLDYTGWPKK